MGASRIASLVAVGMWSLLLVSAAAWAQVADTASIAGVVRDASGAVLPGVTVEATSPALIEKTRSTVTDSSGQYRITELPPGDYETVSGLVMARLGRVPSPGDTLDLDGLRVRVERMDGGRRTPPQVEVEDLDIPAFLRRQAN